MFLEFFSRILALFIIFILSPLLISVIFFCVLFQGFPIFFKQKRVGYQFKTFNIYKFRTMVNNSGRLITELNDNRITFLGRIMRLSKLDEVPQLINIVKGDMRFIGPRPEVLLYFREKDFSFLKIVKPGISDFSSIILRNESKILEKIGGINPYTQLLPIKLELANYYAKNKSFWLDLKLVFITLISLLFPNYAVKSLVVPMMKLNSGKTKKFLIKYNLI